MLDEDESGFIRISVLGGEIISVESEGLGDALPPGAQGELVARLLEKAREPFTKPEAGAVPDVFHVAMNAHYEEICDGCTHAAHLAGECHETVAGLLGTEVPCPCDTDWLD